MTITSLYTVRTTPYQTAQSTTAPPSLTQLSLQLHWEPIHSEEYASQSTISKGHFVKSQNLKSRGEFSFPHFSNMSPCYCCFVSLQGLRICGKPTGTWEKPITKIQADTSGLEGTMRLLKGAPGASGLQKSSGNRAPEGAEPSCLFTESRGLCGPSSSCPYSWHPHGQQSQGRIWVRRCLPSLPRRKRGVTKEAWFKAFKEPITRALPKGVHILAFLPEDGLF